MVDIAKCNRSDCPQKWSCFRYLAFPDELQSYLKIEKKILDGDCKYYWRCRNSKELRIMNRLNRKKGAN